MKKSLLAGLVLTCALVLGGCSKNLGKEISEKEFLTAAEKLDFADPIAITAKGYADEDGKKTEVNWTATKDNISDPQSLVVLTVFSTYSFEYAGLVLSKIKLGGGESKFYQDGAKLGIYGKLESSNKDTTGKMEGKYQYDDHGNPFYVEESQTLSGAQNKSTKVKLEFSYQYK